MTQYTKFTKNISFNENYSNLPTNNGLTTPLNHNLTKTSSRGSNMTGLSANGSPALTLNSNLPKPVLITNLNSSNISSLIKNERIKSSTIARSVTMRYNTNTKLQFDSNNSNNFTNGTNLNPNQAIQANHFHYNRRSLQQPQQPIQQQQQQQIQQPISVDSNLQSKKEYLSLLSNIHRSQSIKINRDKTNLSGYFSGLVSNRDSRLQANGSTNLNGNNNSTNLSTNGNSSTNYLQLNTKYNRKHQPFSLRNNNNSSSMYNTTNNNSNNSINLTGSSDGNYLTNNSVTANSNGLLNSKLINNNSSNNRLSEISKNSISLDNVYNGLDLIIANEQKYNNHKLLEANNKSNTNLGYSSTINSKKSSQNQQAYTSNNSNSFNYTNSNYLMDNSNRVINELNLLKSNNKKRIQKLELDDDITHNSTTLNNNTEEINKELSSSRSNHLKLNDPNENEENNIINNLLDEAEHYHNTKNGLNTTNSINDNSLLKATNYFAKKVKPSKSEMRHVKLNDETIYNNKINKLDLIDQLELYNQQKPSINYLKAAKPLATTSPSANQNSAHSPVNTNTRYKTEMQQQRALIEYNKNAIDSQSKLNHSRSQLTRNHSRLSHITRDINDSYAYTNVQQYIEENDLMPPEKAHSIKKWIVEVNNSFDEWEKKTVEKHIEDSFI